MRPMKWHAITIVAMCALAQSAQAQVGVSDSGQPNYSVPIPVPPGIAGVQPKIGLGYSSSGVSGPVGYNWSLQGISIISRCPATKPVDGVRGSIQFTSTDKLCLDGQRLIQIDSNGNPLTGAASNDALGLSSSYREYRTEKDLYARIRAYGLADSTDAAKGPAYFKIWTKSGQIYEFGAGPSADANTAALITVQGKTTPMVWAIGRVSDLRGNYIDFKYEQRDQAWGSGTVAGTALSGREWNIKEIQYTGNGAQAPANKIVFVYSDRAAASGAEAYHQGSKTVSVRQLDEIRSYVNSANPGSLGPGTSAILIRTQKLAYQAATNTKRLLLQRVTECSDLALTKCLPPTNFSYTSPAADNYQSSAAFASDTLSTLDLTSATGTYGLLTADFNGDGKTDLIRWSDTPSQNKLYLSNGDGHFTEVAGFNIKDQNLLKSDGCYYSMVADFNGDDLPDILRYSSPTARDGSSCSSYGTQYLYINQGGGSFARSDISGVSLRRVKMTVSWVVPTCPPGRTCIPGNPTVTNTEGANFYILDVDGDGNLDLIQTIIPAGSGMGRCSSTVCTRVYLGNGAGSFSETTTNLSNEALYTDPGIGAELTGAAHTVDFNGDGKLDIYIGSYADFIGGGVWRSNGDGNFTIVPTDSGCSNSLDFNGDGKSDCVLPSAIGASSNLLYLSDGGGALNKVAGFNLNAIGAELISLTTDTQAQGMVALDIDGDGRTDIMRWHDDPTKTVLYRSNGDGTFTASSTFALNTSITQLRKSDGSRDFVVGDFTGKGAVEFLRVRASPNGVSSEYMNQLFVKPDSTPHDLLQTVVNSAGSTTTLTYVPLSNSSSGSIGARYASDRGTSYAAVAPKIDLVTPQYVIATVTTDTGVGSNTTSTEYAYRGLKADYTGRGELGFRELRQQSVAANGEARTTVTRRLLDQPYIGSVSRTETRRSAISAIGADQTGTLLGSTVNTYCDTTAIAGAESTATETAPCAVTAKIQAPYLRKSVVTNFDLNGAALPVTTTTNTVNSNGDTTQIVAQSVGTTAGIAQTFTKTTTNQYFADNTSGDNWIRGLLQRSSVASSVPNSLAALTTTAGSSTNASATTGDLTKAPLTSTLSVIMSLLLND